MQIYLAKNQQKYGPYSMDDVRGLLAVGEFTNSDLLWHEGLTEWVTIESVIPPQSPAASVPLSMPGSTPPPPPSYTASAASSSGYQVTSAPAYTVPLTPVVTYAGFGKRVVAYLIDWVILYAISGVFSAFIIGASTVGGEVATGIAGMLLILLTIGGYWLYFALMESSAKQATLGKMVLGIIVTDANGNRIGFGRATGRYFGKILSGFILCIGFLMAAFTERKQALHDMIAGTLVINKNR